MSVELHTKYRPHKLEDVIGQKGLVDSLTKVIVKKRSRAVALVGPSGVGKTTIARIIASMVGCSRGNLIEVDAATNSGIDEMRAVTENIHMAALGESRTRVYIIDEAHGLSKAAWNSLLKVLEEPPTHVWWVLCTTEGSKIPQTIRTRCACYELRPVDTDSIYHLLKHVWKAEQLECPKDVLSLIAEKAQGSVRAALTGLSICGDCTTRKDAAALLLAASEDGEAIDLCRALVRGERNWAKLMALVAPLSTLNGEGTRLTVVGYFTKVLLGTKDANAVARLLTVLDAFSDPYPTGSTVYPVILSLGRIVCAG
jgi:DNA polymerase III gamma/tau subunit